MEEGDNIEHRISMKELQTKVNDLTHQVNGLTVSIQNLLEAGNAAKGMLWGIKWLAAVGSTLAIIAAAFHDWHR